MFLGLTFVITTWCIAQLHGALGLTLAQHVKKKWLVVAHGMIVRMVAAVYVGNKVVGWIQERL